VSTEDGLNQIRQALRKDFTTMLQEFVAYVDKRDFVIIDSEATGDIWQQTNKPGVEMIISDFVDEYIEKKHG
jgi:hypothetical protein